MFEDFDMFMSENQVPPQGSNVSNPSTLVTSNTPIVTTNIQSQELATQVLTYGVDEDACLPPRLVSNAPKWNKQAIYLDDFDFSQIVPIKPNITKKSKTLSRLKIHQSKNKYVEMGIPPLDIYFDKVYDTDYVIKIIDLGRQTHQGTNQVLRPHSNILYTMFNEEKEKKDRLKK